MAWYESILKAAGKEAAGQLLDRIGGPNAKRLKKLFLGKDAEVRETLNRLEEKIGAITKTTKSTRLHQMFEEYNRAHSRLETMYDAYKAQEGKPIEDANRRNACLVVLSSKGAYEQARRMSSALFHKNVQNNMSFFQEYSEDLTDDRPDDDPTPLPDVYSYYDSMQSVMDHLILSLAAAQELRQRCFQEAGSRQDVELSDTEIQGNNQKYAEIVGPARNLIDLFEQCAAAGAYVRLQHCASGNYLTAYAGGRPLSEDEPFGSYSSFQLERKGMPQVFAHGQAKGQVESYQEVTAIRGFSSTNRREVKLDGASQEWKVIKLGREGEPARFIFEGRQSRQALDGVNSGRVYINPLPGDMGNRHMWWQPVLTRTEAGKYEPGVFMLKHVVSDFALDSNGKMVYADGRKPKHSNRHMKWRMVRENLNN